MKNQKKDELLRGYILKYRQNDDQLAYKMFLKEVEKIVSLTLSKKVEAQTDREEIVQEVLLGVHKNLHTYHLDKSLSSWLHSIIYYKLNDHLRKVYRNSHLNEYKDEKQASSLAENEMIIEAKEVLNTLAELEYGDLVLKQKVEGLSNKELAQQYGKSESNIKILIHRTIAKLKKKGNG